MESLDQFSDEQARTLINLRQHYENWMAAERDFAALPYDLRRKEIGGKAYLYEISGRDGNGRSLGPWSPQNEIIYEDYQANKAALKAGKQPPPRRHNPPVLLSDRTPI